ncbi:MAG: Hsp20/alpha crystallin family protein [Chloroflexota bacterium]
MRRMIDLRRLRTSYSRSSSQYETEYLSERYQGRLTNLTIVVKNYGFWRPSVDICETELAFLIKIELSGMRDATIDVMLGRDYLRVSGQRPEQRDDRLQYYHQMGINYGPFDIEIAVRLPIDHDTVVAYYDDGFLFIELPKARDGQPTKVTIPINQS